MDFMGIPDSPSNEILMSYDRRQKKSYQGKRAIAEKRRRISQLFQYGAFISKYLQEGFIRAL